MAVATTHRRFDDEGDRDGEESNDRKREDRPGWASAVRHDRVLPRLGDHTHFGTTERARRGNEDGSNLDGAWPRT
jgi:hypothetical protein